MAINAAVVVSDLHAGSSVGLCHPQSELEEGNIVGFGSNYHQEWLWNCWQAAIEQIKDRFKYGTSNAVWDGPGPEPGPEVALIINGDATESVHHHTKELIAPSLEEHVEIARQCLEPLRSLASKVFVTKGTQCHTEGMETKLAKDLGAETGKARNKWLIDIQGTLIDVAHHIQPASRIYLEATQLSVNLQNAKLNYVRAGQRVPNIFLRGHRHVGGVYNDGDSIMAVTGAWQFLTRHGHKYVTDSIPRPSMVVLDWRNRPQGSLPEVEQIIFNPPQDIVYKA